MFDDTAASMAWVLTTAGCREEAALVERLGSVASRHAAAINELYRQMGLGGLAELADGLRTHGCLTSKRTEQLRALWLEVQERLERLASQPLTSSTESARANIEALHIFGALTITRAGDVAFFVHPDASAANLGRMSRLGPKAAAAHIQQIASIRGEALSHREAQDLYDFHVRRLSDRVQRSFAEVAEAWTRPTRDVRVDVLPTAADFYSAGVEHYRVPPASGQPFTVFATTPGLFLPEERYGPVFFREILSRADLADQTPENDARAPYFTALLQTAKMHPRIYHIDLTRSRAHYQRIATQLSDAEQEQYDRHAFDLLRPMLADPNFGIVGIDRFPVEFDHLSLGSGRSAIVSTRHSGRIGRGMWIRPVDESAMRRALGALDIRSGTEGAFTATMAYLLAGGGTTLGPDLERVALTLFYAPIMYTLLKASFWRPTRVEQAFEDFSMRLRAQPMAVQSTILKQIGNGQPMQPLRSIQDLLWPE